MAKLSIIIPIYKVEKFLRKCIESAINQTLEDIEIILVDDGSPDNSGKICDEYAKKDERIKVIHQVNSGVSVARNAGIEIATGKWLIFMDGDDWASNEMAEKLYNSVEKQCVDIGICAYYENYKTNQNKKSFFEKDEIIFESEADRINLLKKCFSVMGVPWGKIYSKKLIVKNNIEFKPELKRMQDSIFNLYAFQNSIKVKYIDEPLYHYRQFGESACNKYNSGFEETAKRILESTNEFMVKYNLNNELDKEYNNRRIKLFIETVKLKYIPKEEKLSYRKKIQEIKKLKNSNYYKGMQKNINYKDLNFNYTIGAFFIKMNWVNVLYIYYKTIYFWKKGKLF